MDYDKNLNKSRDHDAWNTQDISGWNGAVSKIIFCHGEFEELMTFNIEDSRDLELIQRVLTILWSFEALRYFKSNAICQFWCIYIYIYEIQHIFYMLHLLLSSTWHLFYLNSNIRSFVTVAKTLSNNLLYYGIAFELSMSFYECYFILMIVIIFHLDVICRML